MKGVEPLSTAATRSVTDPKVDSWRRRAELARVSSLNLHPRRLPGTGRQKIAALIGYDNHETGYCSGCSQKEYLQCVTIAYISSCHGPRGLVTSWFRRASPRRQHVVLRRSMIVTWPCVYSLAPSLPSRKRCDAILALFSLGASGTRWRSSNRSTRAGQTFIMMPLSSLTEKSSC